MSRIPNVVLALLSRLRRYGLFECGSANSFVVDLQTQFLPVSAKHWGSIHHTLLILEGWLQSVQIHLTQLFYRHRLLLMDNWLFTDYRLQACFRLFKKLLDLTEFLIIKSKVLRWNNLSFRFSCKILASRWKVEHIDGGITRLQVQRRIRIKRLHHWRVSLFPPDFHIALCRHVWRPLRYHFRQLWINWSMRFVQKYLTLKVLAVQRRIRWNS